MPVLKSSYGRTRAPAQAGMVALKSSMRRRTNGRQKAGVKSQTGMIGFVQRAAIPRYLYLRRRRGANTKGQPCDRPSVILLTGIADLGYERAGSAHARPTTTLLIAGASTASGGTTALTAEARYRLTTQIGAAVAL